MTILLMIAAQAASFDLATVPRAARPRAAPPSLSPRETCPSAADSSTIVVCGRRGDYRLPLPVDRDPGDPDARSPGDLPSGNAALVPAGRCGIFANERNCGKKEARRYGYGGGRDPLTVLAALAGKLIDPDAE